VTVSEEVSGQRIDNFLRRELRGVPKTLVYRLLRRGEVRVNGGRVRPDHRVEGGDDIRLPPVRTGKATERRPSDRVLARLADAVILETDDVIVIDKPSGLAVHGGSGIAYGVVEALRVLRPDIEFLDLVHRLDRDTSGCLVLAKRRRALREVHAAMREGRVEKRYLTLLAGRLPRGDLPLEGRLARRCGKGGQTFMQVASDGKRSRTVLRAVQRFNRWTLAEAELHTGRMHQIRVHCAHAGYPVAGDQGYGDPEANRRIRALGLRRQFLHAAKLGFDLDGERVRVECRLPVDLDAVVGNIREDERDGG